MKQFKEIVWVIMDKNRNWIAKGVPRNRSLVRIDDQVNKERLLTYQSKGKATAGFKASGFYNQSAVAEEYGLAPSWSGGGQYLEAVEVELVLNFK